MTAVARLIAGLAEQSVVPVMTKASWYHVYSYATGCMSPENGASVYVSVKSISQALYACVRHVKSQSRKRTLYISSGNGSACKQVTLCVASLFGITDRNG